MRRFRDRYNVEWDVVLGRESWGALCALFVPVHGSGIRQAAWQARSDNPGVELDELADERVQELLDRSVDKTD